MFDDSFKSRYTTIPFATYTRKGITTSERLNAALVHNHREFELLAILDGKAEIAINGEAFTAKAGDVIVVAPYMLHSITFFEKTNFSHKCLCFDLMLIPDKELKENFENGSFFISPVIPASDSNAEYLTQLIIKAFDAHELQKDGWELEVTGNMCMFFSVMKSEGYIKHTIPSETGMFHRIIGYIDKNYSLPITSYDISKEFFISESYFCRIFKAHFGYPFQKYLGMYRIEKSKSLLKASDISVSEVAVAVGFNSFSYFGKIFRELVGMTPTEFRKSAIQ